LQPPAGAHAGTAKAHAKLVDTPIASLAMPPKKSAAASASAAGAVASTGFEAQERSILSELHVLQGTHLQQRSHGAATWASAVAQLSRQLRELEGVLARLTRLQHQQHTQDKADSKQADAAAAAQTQSKQATADGASDISKAVKVLSLSPSQVQLDGLASWLKAEAPTSLYGESWEFDGHASAAEGTGVRAVKALEKGELFMSIPRKVMMTSDGLAESSPVGQFLVESGNVLVQSNRSLLLAVCLLYERARGDSSYWSAYIRCLPRRFNLPLLWSVDQVHSFLQVSPAVFDVLTLQRAHVRNYTHLHEVLSKGGFLHRNAAFGPGSKGSGTRKFRFSFRDFQWAICVLMSRQNQVPAPALSKKQLQKHRERVATAAATGAPPPPPADRPSIALIPGWDSCNHRGHGAIATFYSPESEASDCHTMEAVPRGNPVYLYYGDRPNQKLMVYAGFVDANHRSDEMKIELSCDGKPWSVALPLMGTAADEAAEATAAYQAAAAAADPLFKIKQMLLKKAGMGSGFILQLPMQDRRSGFESDKAAQSAAAAAAAGGASDEETLRALSEAQHERQVSRQYFKALLHFCRVACLGSKEAASLALKHKPEGFSSASPQEAAFLPSLYAEHDRDAYTFLHDTLTACLHSYPTTREHDESELIRDESVRAADEHEPERTDRHEEPHEHPHALRARHRLALEMRRQEKKMLEAAIAQARQWKEDEHNRLEKAAAAAAARAQ